MVSALADHRSASGGDARRGEGSLDASEAAATEAAEIEADAADVEPADVELADVELADVEPAGVTVGDVEAADTDVPDEASPVVSAEPEDVVDDPHAVHDAPADGRDPYAVDDRDVVDAGSEVVQDDPAPSPAQLRVDFGAHLEANYQRLVALLFAITLDPGEAHDVVQDAYSRAWRTWAVISRSPDPTAWIRRVAVRSTIRSWRRVLSRVGIGRPRSVVDGVDLRTGALLSALARLPAPERRCVVLIHMAGMSLGEIAALEQASPGSIHARLSRARHVVTEGMADVLPAVLGLSAAPLGSYEVNPYVDEGLYR